MEGIYLNKNQNSHILLVTDDMRVLTEAQIFAGYTKGRMPNDGELEGFNNFDVDQWVANEGHFRETANQSSTN